MGPLCVVNLTYVSDWIAGPVAVAPLGLLLSLELQTFNFLIWVPQFFIVVGICVVRDPCLSVWWKVYEDGGCSVKGSDGAC